MCVCVCVYVCIKCRNRVHESWVMKLNDNVIEEVLCFYILKVIFKRKLIFFIFLFLKLF